jgi:hypothetical protein
MTIKQTLMRPDYIITGALLGIAVIALWRLR